MIALSLVADGVPEPHETLNLTLSAPTGGAVLGPLTAATLTILDDSTASPPSWSSVGSLAGRREYHTATLLPSGKVLVAGGAVDAEGVSTAELYDPATGAWSPTGSMSAPRIYHTATLLPTGKVLVTGGRPLIASNPLASSELYDPATGTWSATGSLVMGRDIHGAVLLPTGKVLVAGGNQCFGCGARLASAELYNPATGTWSSTGSMGTGRTDTTLLMLANGKALVVGGFSGAAPLTSSELYNPSTGTWSVTGSMVNARYGGHTVTLLANGKVLVVGGIGITTSALVAAELYDPVAGTWTNTAPPLVAHVRHQAALLPSGKVLVTGGQGPIGTAEIYNPATGTWQATATMATPRALHSMTLLATGKVLVAGGSASADAELFDASSGTWTSTGSLGTGRSGLRASLLPDGRVLASGGSGAPTASQAYDTASGAWTATTGSHGTGRWNHTLTLMANGKVLAAGGFNGSSALSSVELFDPATGTWAATGSLAMARHSHTATLLPNGKVLVAGGSGANPTTSAELYDPAAGTWSVVASMLTPRRSHTATLLPDGRVLVAGGFNAAPYVFLSAAEIYDPRTGAWAAARSLETPRYEHTATLLPNGKVLVAGGLGYFADGVYIGSAELFDPASGAWTSTGALNVPRHAHTATLLPSGRVLIAGGFGGGTFVGAEAYDPAIASWTPVGSLGAARYFHAAALLASGKVLVTGGTNGSAALANSELFDDSAAPLARRPAITAASSIVYGTPFTVTGTQFRGDSEAGSGIPGGGAANFPLLQLRSLTSERMAWLTYDPRTTFSDEPMTLTLSSLPPDLDAVYYAATVFTDGIPSDSRLLPVTCSVAITAQPVNQTVPIGVAAIFSVAAQGARTFQWQKDGVNISGANSSSYTTPPAVGVDAGSSYRVVVGSTLC